MNDRVASAIETLRTELGFNALTLWSPSGDDESDVEAIFFARDEDALMAAAVDFVTRDKSAS